MTVTTAIADPIVITFITTVMMFLMSLVYRYSGDLDIVIKFAGCPLTFGNVRATSAPNLLEHNVVSGNALMYCI